MVNERDEWIKRELDELRDSYRSLEQKLWGMVAAMFLLVVGYLFSQLQHIGSPPPPAAALALIERLLGG